MDIVVVGAGLAGLVAAAEAADAGRSVMLLDQEGEHSLGGQATLGGRRPTSTAAAYAPTATRSPACTRPARSTASAAAG